MSVIANILLCSNGFSLKLYSFMSLFIGEVGKGKRARRKFENQNVHIMFFFLIINEYPNER